MNRVLECAVRAVLLTGVILALCPNTAYGQSGPPTTQTGTVNLSGSVSKFVELASGGSASLSGNVGGGVTTDGISNNALGVVIDMGELGPSNVNEFVKATVPMKLRSNASYALSMSSTVSTTSDLVASDIGFGLDGIARTGAGAIPTGTGAIIDDNHTPGDPTTAPFAIDQDGRYQYTGNNGNLGAFATAPMQILTGGRILNPVPRANAGGLDINARFAVKPQFYSPGSVNVTVTLTATTP